MKKDFYLFSRGVNRKTSCVPGCVSPFGYSDEITLIIDRKIYNYNKFLLSPGIPEITIEIPTKSINKILNIVENNILIYEKNHKYIRGF